MSDNKLVNTITDAAVLTCLVAGISLVWYGFNVKVFHTVRDLSSAILYDKDADEDIN